MTMSTRKLLIWTAVILVGVPAGIVVFHDTLNLLDYLKDTAALLLILSLSVAGWRLKRRLKKRMERGLGRTVDDSELISIQTWMRIPDHAARAARESQEYDFND